MKAPQKISEEGLKNIMRHEGVMWKAYHDPVGLYTIGVGHLLTKQEIASGMIEIGGNLEDYTGGLMQSDCMRLLDQDCDIAESYVNALVTRDITQAQFDSLVSFVFNVGGRAFDKSTLLKVINAGGTGEEIAAQFYRWNKAGGHVLAGLIKRRFDEAKAFL